MITLNKNINLFNAKAKAFDSSFYYDEEDKLYHVGRF
jgi:hypothetical protein